MGQYKACRDHTGREFRSVPDMCKFYNIPRSTYDNRLKRGWTQEQALTVPNDDHVPKVKHRKPIQDHTGAWFPCVREMAEHWGITEKVFWSRKRLLKWPLEKILTTPVKDHEDTANAVAITDHTGQEFKSISAMCRHWKIGLSTYRERRKRGWDMEKALTGKEVQIETDPVECQDHLGNKYPSKNAMCRAWGITRYCYDSRLKLGWDEERALTEPIVINAKPCQDHTGKQFPASVYMALYLGFPKYVFHSHVTNASIPKLAEKYWQDRNCGRFHVIKCVKFPWFEIKSSGQPAILDFNKILDEYHKTDFRPLPETGAKDPYISVIKLLAWPWYLCSINGAQAVLHYDKLIQLHRDCNFGLSEPV